jgi:carboxyl-terminal processing protease
MALPLAAGGLTLLIATAGLGRHARSAPAERASTEANITRLATSLLEHSQFAHRSFDTDLAGTFLDRYIDSLDPTHSVFLQTDVAEFAGYRAMLSKATRDAGDTTAAQAIFQRYLQRLEQRESYSVEMLRTATFDFTGHDVYSYDREHAQRPRDLTAARELWRQQLRADYLQEKLGDKAPAPIAATLTRRYEQQLRTMKALRSDEVLQVYLDALAHVYDPHSDYLGHEEMDSFSIAMKLSLFGIGATLESVDGVCTIRALTPGGPAARSGLLKRGDRIVAVAQAGKPAVDIMNVPLTRSVELIRGPKGSTVTLTIVPSGAPEGTPPKAESVVRDEIHLADQAAKARIVDLPDGKASLRLGVIDLPSFYNGDPGGEGAGEARSATADVALLLAKLNAEHVQGIVLDLRHNGGGSLDEAITLTGLFIRKGPVVQTRDQAGAIRVGADSDPGVAYDGPLVVLTSRFTASASEIVAGALQDYGRALIVGDSSTFGKGTVQLLMPLAPVMDRMHLAHAYDPGALKVTTDKFYRPSGASTQLRGVASDLVLPSTSDFDKVSESAMKDALPWDVVPSTSYERLNRVAPYVEALRENSSRRVAADKEFGELAGDVARLKKSMAAKTVSLNEAERREELEQAKARLAEREREERNLCASRPAVHEIALEQASRPGLPPPTPCKAVAPPGAASAPDTRPIDEFSPGGSSEDAIVLGEGERILADYVRLSTAPPPQ